MLTYTAPSAVRDALRWRHSTLHLAKERARVLGMEGAAFPWRTIRGEETSGYWPAGTAAFHINADIADAVVRYHNATLDDDFDRDFGAELLIETARLWASLGHFDPEHGFRIDGVTGPDEYTAVVDNNVYTNLMAQRNLREAAEAVRRQPDVAGRLQVRQDEVETWLRAASLMAVPYDTQRGVHMQSDAFTHHEEWDFEGTPPEKYPLLLHYPYFEIYRKQVVKQADLVMALHLRGDAFTLEEKIANFAYYEARTTRDSSLSATQQAIVAAETGHLQLAYEYWAEAALTDLQNLHHNSGHGLHMASLAGGWSVAVAGFGGMRDHNGELTFGPRLPETDHPAAVPRGLPGAQADRHGDAGQGHLPAGRRRSAGHPPPRPPGDRRPRGPRARDPARPAAGAGDPAQGLRAAAARPALTGQVSSQVPPRTSAPTSTSRKAPTHTRAGTRVSRASWSASESGVRRRLRVVCSSRTARGAASSRNQVASAAKAAWPSVGSHQVAANTTPPVTRTDHSPYQLRICTSSSARSSRSAHSRPTACPAASSAAAPRPKSPGPT